VSIRIENTIFSCFYFMFAINVLFFKEKKRIILIYNHNNEQKKTGNSLFSETRVIFFLGEMLNYFVHTNTHTLTHI
jgi:hypothetical protein